MASNCIGYKVISIASSNHIGQIRGILINPQRFSVTGFWVEEYNRKRNYWPILLSQSLRQIHGRRIFVNDTDDINAPSDLPRLKRVLRIDYQIPGKRIISSEKQYLGRAEDFSFNDENFKIIHLVVKPPLHQRFSKTRQHFTRSQIEKVSKNQIEVRISPQTQLHSLPDRLTP